MMADGVKIKGSCIIYPLKDISIEYNKLLNLKINNCILTETEYSGYILNGKKILLSLKSITAMLKKLGQ